MWAPRVLAVRPTHVPPLTSADDTEEAMRLIVDVPDSAAERFTGTVSVEQTPAVVFDGWLDLMRLVESAWAEVPPPAHFAYITDDSDPDPDRG